VPGCWLETSSPQLQQGDLLPECQVPIYPAEIPLGSDATVQVLLFDLIVLTQTCDPQPGREQPGRARLVALCPITTLEKFATVNPQFASRGRRTELAKRRLEGLYLLPDPLGSADEMQARVVDFREIYSIPHENLLVRARALARRWRLVSPFLEDFSQYFGRYFMRVALPSIEVPPRPGGQ